MTKKTKIKQTGNKQNKNQNQTKNYQNENKQKTCNKSNIQ